MKGARLQWTFAAVGLALGLAAACNTHPATQVLVFVHAEPGLREQASRIQIQVEGPEGDTVADEDHPLPEESTGSIARVPLVPKGGDATRTFRLVATLTDGDGQKLVSGEVVSGYDNEKLREIHLWLDEQCQDVSCDPGRTCDRGTCVGACFDPAKTDAVDRSDPTCGECQRCEGGSCVPVEDGTPCGCTETDECKQGECVTSRPVRKVIVGKNHTCAILDDISLWCWGDDRTGQLGNGEQSGDQPAPTLVGGDGAWAQGDAGADHTCLLNFGGGRKCWGWRGSGALGIGSTEDGVEESPVEGPSDDPSWSRLTAGRRHTCGVTEDNRIYCWGLNGRGQAGVDPEQEGTVGSPAPLDERTDWASVSGGGFHTCARRQDGTIWCWGLNDSGELGVGDTVARHTPVQTGCPDGECIDDWVSITSGAFHSCAIREGGELWCWGGNLNGQLGVGPTMDTDSTRPLQVESGTWRAVQGGTSHTCGIRQDGTLWCWGENDDGQLGVGNTNRRAQPTAVEVRTPNDWFAVRPGGAHTCAIRSDGSLWCWGSNDQGQLGHGADAPARETVPQRVCFPPG
jgi:alpha-tubulin suppressor-like RCC1 family protein